ncbi:MAG: DUF433 domain-containing protein [Saprospiraceae bacterium]|nr:DUF433 domain-containing protein [Saprospiraceae bacterium]
MENWSNYIHSDPKIMMGKPVIKGTRITVELIVERLGYGQSPEDLLVSYPHLTKEAILACLSYAAGILKNEAIHPLQFETYHQNPSFARSIQQIFR